MTTSSTIHGLGGQLANLWWMKKVIVAFDLVSFMADIGYIMGFQISSSFNFIFFCTLKG